MGLEEKIAAEKSLPERIWARAKPIAEMSLEKIADAAPWAGGIAVGAGAYYILNNINFVGIDFLLIDSLTESQKLIYSLGLSSLFAVITRNIINYTRHSHLFRNISRSNQDISLEEICENVKEKAEVDGNSSESNLWRAFKFGLRYPKTTAALIFSKSFYSIGSDIYNLCNTYFETKSNLLEIIAQDTPLSPKWHSDMAALDYLKEVSVGMGQVITGHVLSGITLFLIAVFSIKLVDNISPNSNYFKSFAKGFYYNLKGDKDAELRCNEEIIKNLPSRKGYFDLASSYSQKGNLDEALEAWSHGFRLSPVPTNLQKMFQTIGILFANPYIKHYKAYLKQIRKKSEEVKNYIDLSMLHMNLNNIDESLAVQEQMRERFPERADSRALYALMLGGLGRQEEAKEKWGETVGILLKGTDASLKFRKIGESVNDVLEYSPSKFFKNSILFKKNHLNDLEDEVMLTGEAMKIVKDAGKSDVYFTTEPISIFNYEDRHAYVMKRDPGKLLYDIQERTDAVYRVADYLALIHAKMNVELTKKGRVNIPKTLEEKLGSRDLNLPEHIITKIKSNYAPVFDSLKNATYVFNKDAHPEQWLVREDGGIVAIDWEDKGLVPMQFDLANLMEYDDSLKDSDKDGIMRNYFDAYLRYRNGEQIGDYNAFRLGYFNSTIHRALSLCSSWSSPGREDMASKRELLIRNALNSIERIKEESPEYYLRYRENYHNLTSALLDFRSLIVEHEN